MKRLAALCVIIGLIGAFSPAYGYILVYKLTTTLKTVETDSNVMMREKVTGYLALDINDVEETVADACMVIYGKDVNAVKLYYVEDFHGAPNVQWTEEGAYLTVSVVNHRNPFDYDIRLTGKIKQIDVGLGNTDPNKRSAASSLKGSMLSTRGTFFDPNQTFFGSGSATMTLDLRKSRTANTVPYTIDEIIEDIISGERGLLSKDYQEVII